MILLDVLHGAVLAVGALTVAALLLFVLPIIYVLLLGILVALVAIFVRLGRTT